MDEHPASATGRARRPGDEGPGHRRVRLRRRPARPRAAGAWPRGAVCLVRDPRKLDAAEWRHDVEIVRADIAGDLTEAMADVDVAVFLVHSIGEGADWVARERAHRRELPRRGRGRRACGASCTSAGSATTTPS